jgi:hypothetical protein
MSLCIDVRLERLFAPPCVGTGHRFIDSSGHQVILDFRLRQSEIGNLACHSSLVTGHCPFDLRFSESTKWFIFSPGTVDNRSGGVWAARLIVNVPVCPHFRPRTSYPGLRTLRLATGHSLLVFFDLGLRTSDFGPCISTLFFFDFGPRTSDPVSRHCSFSTSDFGLRTVFLVTALLIFAQRALLATVLQPFLLITRHLSLVTVLQRLSSAPEISNLPPAIVQPPLPESPLVTPRFPLPWPTSRCIRKR